MKDARKPKTYSDNRRVYSDFRLRCPAAAALRPRSCPICFHNHAFSLHSTAAALLLSFLAVRSLSRATVGKRCWTLCSLMTTWTLWSKIARVNNELYVLLWCGRVPCLGPEHERLNAERPQRPLYDVGRGRAALSALSTSCRRRSVNTASVRHLLAAPLQY